MVAVLLKVVRAGGGQSARVLSMMPDQSVAALNW